MTTPQEHIKWTIEKAIGHNIRQAREARRDRRSQADLGEDLAPFTGREWSKQEVAAAEAGNRKFPAQHLLAFAMALDLSFEELMAPHPGRGVYDLDSGGYVQLPRYTPAAEQGPAFREIDTERDDLLLDLDDIQDTLSRAVARVHNLERLHGSLRRSK